MGNVGNVPIDACVEITYKGGLTVSILIMPIVGENALQSSQPFDNETSGYPDRETSK